MEEAKNDERFSHLFDHRFKMPKRFQKGTIDKRFKNMFKDKNFTQKCTMDKRGRPLNLTPSENLKKLYNIASESSENDDDDNDKGDEDINKNLESIDHKNKLEKSTDSPTKSDSSVRKSEEKVNRSTKILNKGKKAVLSDQDIDENSMEELDGSGDSESDDILEDQITGRPKIKGKKEEASVSEEDTDESSSEESDVSESESEDSSENEGDDIDHKWEELRHEAPDTNEITRRLAVCNMDWDRIRATDLFVCFNSFKPSDGSINSVKIYPSEYGLKRMEEEKCKGPPELVEKTLALDEEELEDRMGSRFHREKLRQYQISRLKYYYAIIDCDSPETANVLYEQLNGMEYESSSVRFDLRFVPDDVTFDHKPTSIADKLPDPTEYKPRLFVTSALQQVKVDLTWDETEPKRKEFFQKVFTDPDSIQNDIESYVASASSESEVEENTNDEEEHNKKLTTKERMSKYRELLLSLEEKEKEEENKCDIEVTWEPSLKEKTEEKVKEKIKRDTLNPFEEMIQKKKEERKLKKKELKEHKQAEGSLSDDSEEELSDNSSMSNVKAKDEKRLAELALISDSKKEVNFEEMPRKNKKDKSQELDHFVGDPNDPRFAAMYTSSLFNLIPSNQKTKKHDSNFSGKSEKRKFKTKFHGLHKKPKY